MGGRSPQQHEVPQRPQPVAEGHRHAGRLGHRRRAARQPGRRPGGGDLRQRLAARRARFRVRAADRVDGEARRAGAVPLLLREDPVRRGQVGRRGRDAAQQLQRGAPLGRLHRGHPRRPHGEGRLHVRPAGQADLALGPDGQEGHLGRRHAAGRRRQDHLLRARPRLRAAPRGLRQADSRRQVRALGDALQPHRRARPPTAASSACGGTRARCATRCSTCRPAIRCPAAAGAASTSPRARKWSTSRTTPPASAARPR